MFCDNVCLERVRALQLGGTRRSVDVCLAKTVRLSRACTCVGVCDWYMRGNGGIKGRGEHHLLNNEAP